MEKFAYVKLLHATGKAEQDNFISPLEKIHHFNENTYNPFQLYKIDKDNGDIVQGTVAFIANAEDMNDILNKKGRHRAVNKKYLLDPHDTTDTETEGNFKRKTQTVQENKIEQSLNNRLENLKKKQKLEKSSSGGSSQELNSLSEEIDLGIQKSNGNKKFVEKKTIPKKTNSDLKKPTAADKSLKQDSLNNSANGNRSSTKQTAPTQIIKSGENTKLEQEKTTTTDNSSKPDSLKFSPNENQNSTKKKIPAQTMKSSGKSKVDSKKPTAANESLKQDSLKISANGNGSSMKQTAPTQIIKSGENTKSEQIKIAPTDNSSKPDSLKFSANKNKNSTKQKIPAQTIKSAGKTKADLKKPTAADKSLKQDSLNNSANGNRSSTKQTAPTQIIKSGENTKLEQEKTTTTDNSPKPDSLMFSENENQNCTKQKISAQTMKSSKKTKVDSKKPTAANKSLKQDSFKISANKNENSTKQTVPIQKMMSGENTKLARQNLTAVNKTLKTFLTEHPRGGNKNAIKQKNVEQPFRDPLRVMQLNISNQTVNNGKQLKNDKEDGRSSFSKKLEDEAETERCLQIQRLQVKKLSDTLKATQDRLKVLKAVHEEKIDELSRAKDDLDQLETELHKTQNELERTKQMNINWQNTAINKCNLMHAMFTEWKETQDNLTTQITYPPVGYVTETESHIHLGRGEWLPYNAYALAISNISMKNRKVLFRNISVALLGYDALAKTTITGKGSNRNQGTKVPESKLDPKKLLAIKDIYRHFCITELRMDQIDAELEAGEANERIRKKISQLKGIKNKPKKSGQNILGNTAEVLTEKEDEQEIRGGMINEEERVMETEGDERIYNQGVTDELVGDYIVDDEGNDKEGNGEEGNDEGGNDEEGNDEEGNDEERNDEVNDVGDDETMADEGVDNEEVNDDDAMYDDEVDNEEVDDDEAMDDDVVDNEEVDDDEAMDDDEVDNEEVDDDEAMDDKVYEEQIYDDSIQIDDFNCSVENENSIVIVESNPENELGKNPFIAVDVSKNLAETTLFIDLFSNLDPLDIHEENKWEDNTYDAGSESDESL